MVSVTPFSKHNGSNERMATVLADKMFKDYKSSLSRQHTQTKHSLCVTEFRTAYFLDIQPYCQRYRLFANGDLIGLIKHPNLFRYIQDGPKVGIQ